MSLEFPQFCPSCCFLWEVSYDPWKRMRSSRSFSFIRCYPVANLESDLFSGTANDSALGGPGVMHQDVVCSKWSMFSMWCSCRFEAADQAVWSLPHRASVWVLGCRVFWLWWSLHSYGNVEAVWRQFEGSRLGWQWRLLRFCWFKACVFLFASQMSCL